MVTYAIEGPILEMTAQGVYTTEEIAAAFAAAKADSLLPATPLLLLIDFHESHSNPSYSDLRSRWALIQQLGPHRVAFVVRTVAQSRLGQLYQGLAAEAGGAPAVEVFMELEAARDWLRM